MNRPRTAALAIVLVAGLTIAVGGFSGFTAVEADRTVDIGYDNGYIDVDVDQSTESETCGTTVAFTNEFQQEISLVVEDTNGNELLSETLEEDETHEYTRNGEGDIDIQVIAKGSNGDLYYAFNEFVEGPTCEENDESDAQGPSE